ncbi:DUF4167 domain-containing protein [Brevundimonas viscosa]|uniref:DUF4167 domain-containing protein n=1 Tax=Brevundimonas viscosa TaxID=871741 RepID=A0A1I6PB19_9CAUL|nr:DUF4167 domain-containing protein [Brevundimonas viscosa]SFS37335.1 protein of unknown function [Brevundimonas viscosa]
MRDFKGMKRQRGRNRKPGGGNANATNPNRSWDSQGPENIKVRGNAQTVYERYMQLARDAAASGDRVLAENYTQHAEHYFRVLRALQPQRPVSEIAQRELAGQGFDIDFEDESGAQAAAIMAAQQAEADRAAEQERRQREQDERRERQGQSQGQDGERREWRDRDDREPREPREPRAEGEGGEAREGGRRESRRERWERRREERNRRFETERGEGGEAPAAQTDEIREDAAPAPAAETAPEARPARERGGRRPRRDEAADETPAALPGFLTRSAAPAVAVESPAGDADEAPAPKRRAPRRKAEVPADES